MLTKLDYDAMSIAFTNLSAEAFFLLLQSSGHVREKFIAFLYHLERRATGSCLADLAELNGGSLVVERAERMLDELRELDAIIAGVQAMDAVHKEAKSPRDCGRCHSCGTLLSKSRDGEEWCPKCSEYRRYTSHGWGRRGNPSPCPDDGGGKDD